MAIKDWPIQERPREKLLNRGPSALSDAELLAILFRTGVKGKTALDLARDLLNKFGSLRTLLNADQDEFCQISGLGYATYVQIKACLELSRRFLGEVIQRQDLLSCPQDTRKYLLARLRDYTYEVFACLFLDKRNHLISFDELFKGTIDSTYIHPRIILKLAFKYNASGLICVHNHPSGCATPSEYDIKMTRNLQRILKDNDIRLLDHFVVGDGIVSSLAELGFIH